MLKNISRDQKDKNEERLVYEEKTLKQVFFACLQLLILVSKCERFFYSDPYIDFCSNMGWR